MNIDLALSNAKIYGVKKFDIVKGQKFDVYTDNPGPLQFFANNDPALSLQADNTSFSATADNVGAVVILIMDSNFTQLDKIDINVVDAIIPPAKTLGVTADEPIAK